MTAKGILKLRTRNAPAPAKGGALTHLRSSERLCQRDPQPFGAAQTGTTWVVATDARSAPPRLAEVAPASRDDEQHDIVVLTTDVLPFSSPVGVAASTLAAGALFHSLRRRETGRRHRRFNTARYDAEAIGTGGLHRTAALHDRPRHRAGRTAPRGRSCGRALTHLALDRDAGRGTLAAEHSSKRPIQTEERSSNLAGAPSPVEPGRQGRGLCVQQHGADHLAISLALASYARYPRPVGLERGKS